MLDPIPEKILVVNNIFYASIHWIGLFAQAWNLVQVSCPGFTKCANLDQTSQIFFCLKKVSTFQSVKIDKVGKQGVRSLLRTCMKLWCYTWESGPLHVLFSTLEYPTERMFFLKRLHTAFVVENLWFCGAFVHIPTASTTLLFMSKSVPTSNSGVQYAIGCNYSCHFAVTGWSLPRHNGNNIQTCPR